MMVLMLNVSGDDQIDQREELSALNTKVKADWEKTHHYFIFGFSFQSLS